MLIVNVERLNSAAHGGGELRSVLDIGAAKAIVPQLVKLITISLDPGSAADSRLCRRLSKAPRVLIITAPGNCFE